VRVAIADPPYPGNSEKLYGNHRDYAGEVDHEELIERLEDEFPDGWALCTGAKNAWEVMNLCPPVRQLIWRKPGTPFGDGFLWTYEPVLLRRCRPPERPHVADMVYAVPQGMLTTFREKPQGHVTGAKPPPFCRWLFRCMGLHPDDEVVDLFPGSGAIGLEWDAWRAQPSLLSAGTEEKGGGGD
jgi:hypothetical protein